MIVFTKKPEAQAGTDPVKKVRPQDGKKIAADPQASSDQESGRDGAKARDGVAR